MDSITIGKDTLVVEDCEDAWTAGTNVTANLDSSDYMKGAGSAELVVDAAASAGAVIGYEDITSVDLSGYDTILVWIKSTVALSAGDLDFLVDNTSGCVSPLESIDIPAVSANTWTRCTLTIATPGSLTAVISVGLKMVVDKGAFTVNIDDVVFCNSKSFNVLAVKGLDDPEHIYRWPNIRERLLDGSHYKKDSRFGRVVTVQFYPITAEADRTWLMKALLDDSIRIVGSSDEIEGVDGMDEESEFQWIDGIDFLHTAIVQWREKEPLWSSTKVPPSWS